ncbi:MAG: homoserine kinase [Acidobacteria bacterium]|nr:homoserine kinase [Acidobacteriota bacterium]
MNLSLPASSANLGPAFDAAAVALNLLLKVRAQNSHRFSIVARGRDTDICGRIENHLILSTYEEILRSEKKTGPALALTIDNGFPIGKGLGSSAAARLAGIALAVHFGRLRWDSPRIIYEASIREHHPDNASACWMGGITLARIGTAGARAAEVAQILPKGRWPLLLAVPEASLSTEKARAVLPKQYSRADAVANIQNSMLLAAALFTGNRRLLASSLEDRIHQPYRARLCPLLPALTGLPATDGVLGAALSGAGPSVLIFLDPARPLMHTVSKVKARLKTRALQAELILTTVAKRGAEASLFKN